MMTNDEFLTADAMLETQLHRYEEEIKPLARLQSGKIDDLLGGIKAGRVIFIGGKPGIGKTSLALMLANECARSGALVLFITLEVPVNVLLSKSLVQLSNRGLSSVSLDEILTSGSLDEATQQLIDMYKSEIGKNICFLSGKYSASKISLAAKKCKQIYQRTPIVFVDYLQLIESDPGTLQAEQVRLKHVAQTIRRIASENKTCVFAVSSVSRSSYTGAPNIDALGGSGSLEYTADVIAVLAEGKSESKKSLIGNKPLELITVKNRYSPTGKIKLKYCPDFALFDEI